MPERKYIKTKYGMTPILNGLPAPDALEQMAGANKWHQVSREVFIEKFLQQDHAGTNFVLIDNQGLAETLLHQGMQIVESDEEFAIENCGGYKQIAIDFYREYKKQVKQVGGGDVAEYAKRASGKTRKELWGF